MKAAKAPVLRQWAAAERSEGAAASLLQVSDQDYHVNQGWMVFCKMLIIVQYVCVSQLHKQHWQVQRQRPATANSFVCCKFLTHHCLRWCRLACLLGEQALSCCDRSGEQVMSTLQEAHSTPHRDAPLCSSDSGSLYYDALEDLGACSVGTLTDEQSSQNALCSPQTAQAHASFHHSEAPGHGHASDFTTARKELGAAHIRISTPHLDILNNGAPPSPDAYSMPAAGRRQAVPRPQGFDWSAAAPHADAMPELADGQQQGSGVPLPRLSKSDAAFTRRCCCCCQQP